jgi:hypothetical protein
LWRSLTGTEILLAKAIRRFRWKIWAAPVIKWGRTDISSDEKGPQ